MARKTPKKNEEGGGGTCAVALGLAALGSIVGNIYQASRLDDTRAALMTHRPRSTGSAPMPRS